MKTKLIPPGPKNYLLVSNTIEFARNPLEFLSRCARQYGDVVKLQLPFGRTYLLNHPDDVEFMLTTSNRNFKKGKAFEASRLVLGNGLVTSEGDFWLRQRRLMQPAFHRERIKTYAEVMVDYTTKMLDQWQDGQIHNLEEDMQKLTLQIVNRLLFGLELSGDKAAEVSGKVEHAFKEIQDRLVNPLHLPESVPTPGNRRYLNTIRELDRVIFEIIEQRRANPGQKDDLLAILLEAQDEDGRQMTDQQLRDELLTLFIAGHETTALAMTWAFYLLSQHPEVETRLLDELNQVLQGRTPQMADLPRLPYTELVIKETLRLYSPAQFLFREALTDCEIGGYPVPAGTQLIAASWVLHRDPRFYDQPDEFRPERWESEKAKNLPKYAYAPFGGGPRLCIGNTFALTEAALLLATIAQRYRLSLKTTKPVIPQVQATLHPKYPLLMQAASRPLKVSLMPDEAGSLAG